MITGPMIENPALRDFAGSAPPSHGFASTGNPSNLIELLMSQAERAGEQRAFTFLGDDDVETSITYAELDRRARSIAARLSRMAQPGDRALLVYPSGLDFISAFFGCVYAGVLAVPATFPKPRRPMPRLISITRDCGAKLALTTTASLSMFDLSLSPELAQLHWIATDETDDAVNDWARPPIDGDDLCFLQYTSGSTSEPKGVMVSHGNLLANMELILVGNGVDRQLGENPARRGVFWLPAYHDMGLICGILGAVYEGGHSVLMSPTSFLHRPIRWLQAISKYQAEVSGAPNFAFELCVRKTKPEERAQLDLRSWRVAFCSAEPVRPETLERFAQAFAPAGFCPESFYPCYGLAEATLMAAGNRGPGGVAVKRVLRAALAEHRWADAKDDPESHVQRMVGCGGELLDQRLAIVDPHTRLRTHRHAIGEIWTKGPCVAQGYWGREAETQHVFRARLADTGDGPYLRTGDLGFMHDGQLFVTGRVKDVIIIRGRNHYPQDIEHSAETAHPALAYGAGAAFAIESNNQERLIVVHEIDRHHRDTDFDDVIRRIRAAVADEHDLEVAGVALIRQAGLPRTTSGKKQRVRCRELYLASELNLLSHWTAAETALPHEANGRAVHGTPGLLPRTDRPLGEDEIERLGQQIEDWLLQWLTNRTGAALGDTARDRAFAEYGLDSLAAVELSQELEHSLDVKLSSVIAWKYPTPASMARYLARKVGGAAAASGAGPSAMRKRNAAGFARLLAEIEILSDDDVRRQLAE
jgi:acyl-CoA synthetase (AMP-forming)/AMP-acid ligase II/acyl carrier protein